MFHWRKGLLLPSLPFNFPCITVTFNFTLRMKRNIGLCPFYVSCIFMFTSTFTLRSRINTSIFLSSFLLTFSFSLTLMDFIWNKKPKESSFSLVGKRVLSLSRFQISLILFTKVLSKRFNLMNLQIRANVLIYKTSYASIVG